MGQKNVRGSGAQVGSSSRCRWVVDLSVSASAPLFVIPTEWNPIKRGSILDEEDQFWTVDRLRAKKHQCELLSTNSIPANGSRAGERDGDYIENDLTDQAVASRVSFSRYTLSADASSLFFGCKQLDARRRHTPWRLLSRVSAGPTWRKRL
ncbi:hypothetical protein ABW21_db0203007 [Orbilia brochopaga]|nr:hypothetical protein ABW21_db0203007 [Drechslerella brochopaga]